MKDTRVTWNQIYCLEVWVDDETPDEDVENENTTVAEFCFACLVWG